MKAHRATAGPAKSLTKAPADPGAGPGLAAGVATGRHDSGR